MAKRAICIGINDYPEAPLSGCLNDAHDWADLLENEFAFDDVSLLTDAEASRDAILEALGDLVDGAERDDVVVFTYSGHGTWVPDQGEFDESDNRDEAICAHDANILDDEIRAVIRRLNPDARLTVISDSCHSGTITRAMLLRSRGGDGAATPHTPKPRYLPPEHDARRTTSIPIRKRFLYPESDLQEVLLTGCNATEYSYDAYIDGRFNGAMTATALRLIRSDPTQSYRDFHRALREQLPSTEYQQSPQLEGSDANKDRPLFT